MSKKIREGTAIRALIGSRIRHTIAETVTNQNTLVVRLGLNGNESLHTVTRQPSTSTRGTLFKEIP